MKPLAKVFLDLEDTIIISWDNPTLINVDAIRQHLVGRGVSTISIFSFAIWEENDQAVFVSKGIKASIEKALNVEVIEWLSIKNMRQIVEEWSGFRYSDRIDFMQLHGKHDAFIKVCLAREEKIACQLIDDAIPHRTIIDHTRELMIDLLPVQLLTKEPVGNERSIRRL